MFQNALLIQNAPVYHTNRKISTEFSKGRQTIIIMLRMWLIQALRFCMFMVAYVKWQKLHNFLLLLYALLTTSQEHVSSGMTCRLEPVNLEGLEN